jgi:hypothetical protein
MPVTILLLAAVYLLGIYLLLAFWAKRIAKLPTASSRDGS